MIIKRNQPLGMFARLPLITTRLPTPNRRTADRYTALMRQDPLSYLSDELDALRQQNLYRRLRVLEDEQKAHTTFDHRSVVNLSSNNYLGLTTHPRLRQKALEAVEQFGVGTGSVRTIAGTMAMHMELERKLAEFKKVDAVVVFQSGFTANAGTVSAILTKEDVVISDELNHASIIDGCRLSRAAIKVFPHKDVDAARKLIEGLPAGQRKLLITDGVFSMDGDLGPLPELCELAEQTGCIMMVDDAHASGVFGRNGRGTIDHFGVHGRVDVQVGTLSKAIGALGGYVAGTQALIEFLYHRARPFLFSTSHPPAVAAACMAAIDVLLEEPEIIDRLWENTRFFKSGLEALGFNTGVSESPITPVITGDGAVAMKLSDRLFQEGVFAQGIAFPTVAKDKARVRTIVTATHTRDHLQFALDTFGKVGKELGIV
jgi:glycine C-acetyltransferase